MLLPAARLSVDRHGVMQHVHSVCMALQSKATRIVYELGRPSPFYSLLAHLGPACLVAHPVLKTSHKEGYGRRRWRYTCNSRLQGYRYSQSSQQDKYTLNPYTHKALCHTKH